MACCYTHLSLEQNVPQPASSSSRENSWDPSQKSTAVHSAGRTACISLRLSKEIPAARQGRLDESRESPSPPSVQACWICCKTTSCMQPFRWLKYESLTPHQSVTTLSDTICSLQSLMIVHSAHARLSDWQSKLLVVPPGLEVVVKEVGVRRRLDQARNPGCAAQHRQLPPLVECCSHLEMVLTGAWMPDLCLYGEHSGY